MKDFNYPFHYGRCKGFLWGTMSSLKYMTKEEVIKEIAELLTDLDRKEMECE
jgi:hypothetical protein